MLLTKRIRTEVDRHNRKRQTHLLQTRGVKLRLIDDLYSHLGVKKTKKTACVSLLLRVYAPVQTLAQGRRSSLYFTSTDALLCGREACAEKKGTTQSRKWQIRKEKRTHNHWLGCRGCVIGKVAASPGRHMRSDAGTYSTVRSEKQRGMRTGQMGAILK